MAQGLGERPAVAGVRLHQHHLAHLPCRQAGFTPGEAVRHRGHRRPHRVRPLTLGYRGLRGLLVLDRRYKRSRSWWSLLCPQRPDTRPDHPSTGRPCPQERLPGATSMRRLGRPMLGASSRRLPTRPTSPRSPHSRGSAPRRATKPGNALRLHMSRAVTTVAGRGACAARGRLRGHRITTAGGARPCVSRRTVAATTGFELGTPTAP